MKKLLLSAAAIMAFSVVSHAQEIKFGVKAGLNIADFGGDAETEGSRTGFHAGGLAEFKLTETFSIQPELLYSMQGAKGKDILTGEEYDLKFDYINIPIMAKYYLMEGLSIEAGPQVGFLMSAKAEDEDIKDSYKSIDIALNGGVAYDLPMGLFFQARYSAGISDISDIEGSDDKITNNVISLSVGYKF
ncbi:PorT family protein [Flavobacterium salilacus subsp. salilacus]|uniref:porin family protein n=1 Tax=Flavobacterium TaxID=237 RepID=UPI001074E759|nr:MULTISPECIES: porin family protein [Flavobacterium]KAF2518520.1 PorT family protein [Flavobacterium salilacus subsp. salilacus]MBE1615162.1 PorT family protein [Flavobacterium sp. SaA2.13]